MPFLDEDGVTRLVQDLLPHFSNKDALDDVFANFATIETSSTASKAYSVNDLLVKDDTLYRVTSNIASGGTITVGTNVVALQIEDIYDLVNTKLNISDYRSGMTWAELEDAITWGEFEGDISDSGTTYTENYHLTKPGLQSDASIVPINSNMDIIDETIEGTQSSIAMIESHTAQSNHALGSYFMLDNVLHKATSAIASGETITPGTNATPITLEQALTALNTSIQSLQDSLVYTKDVHVGNQTWRLTQYPDGTVTAFTWWRISLGAYTQWGNLYTVKALDPVTYPISFSESPCVRLELYGTSSAVSSLYLYGDGTNTTSPQVWALRPDAASSGHSIGLAMYVTGRAPSIR